MAEVSNERPVAMDRDWAELKAMEIIPHGMSRAQALRRDIVTALREADERARAEERGHGIEALKLAQRMQEKAVAAERENSSRERISAVFQASA